MRARGNLVIVAAVLSLAASARATPSPVIKASLPRPHPSPWALLERPGLKPGMAVLDQRGRRIGVIVQTGQTRDDQPAVLVRSNGVQYTIRDAELRRARHGEQVIAELSRSQLRTRGILNG